MSDRYGPDAHSLPNVPRLRSDPFHAAVSWTYMPPDRYEEALLRIRRLLKEHAGWWSEHDEQLEREALKRLGLGA